MPATFHGNSSTKVEQSKLRRVLQGLRVFSCCEHDHLGTKRNEMEPFSPLVGNPADSRVAISTSDSGSTYPLIEFIQCH